MAGDFQAVETRTPLEQLIDRAQTASEAQSTNKRNKALIRDMAIAIVAQARLIADMQQKLTDKPRIIVP